MRAPLPLALSIVSSRRAVRSRARLTCHPSERPPVVQASQHLTLFVEQTLPFDSTAPYFIVAYALLCQPSFGDSTMKQQICGQNIRMVGALSHITETYSSRLMKPCLAWHRRDTAFASRTARKSTPEKTERGPFPR